MPVGRIQKFLFTVLFALTAVGLFAAPLSGNYPSAPRATPAEARQRVVDAAKRYLGAPYQYTGSTMRGMDCSGLIFASFSDALGVTVPRTAAQLHNWSEKIPIGSAQAGDLLFFRTGAGTSITHVAIFLGNRQFIHSASAGSKTGVIYSSLDEQYWARAFVTAGRALPAATSGGTTTTPTTPTTPDRPGQPGTGTTSRPGSSGLSLFSGTNLYTGFAFAPSWNVLLVGDDIIRGYSSQILFGVELGPWFTFGIELRPEYDALLGVVRIPLTLSWGHSDKLRFFAGAAYTYGNPSIDVDGKNWPYFNGTAWFGTAGVTYAPYTMRLSRSQFAPYIEGAWQSYISDNDNSPTSADLSARFRISTGLRWKMYL